MPILALYRFVTLFVCGFELHEKTKLKIYHRGHSIIINPCTIIGNNVEIRQNTTIGSTKISVLGNDAAPIIKDNVCIGAMLYIGWNYHWRGFNNYTRISCYKGCPT